MRSKFAAIGMLICRFVRFPESIRGDPHLHYRTTSCSRAGPIAAPPARLQRKATGRQSTFAQPSRDRKVADSWHHAAPPLISRAMKNILPIIIADAPGALIELCGVNLMERLLRILQRLGFRHVIVFSTTPEIVGAELATR